MDGQSSPRRSLSSSNAKSKTIRRSGQPPRKRVSQACDRCRHKKDKCDGRRPACSACTRRHQTCSYDRSIKRRGLPEGYVRDLELQSQGLDAYVQDLELAWALAVGIDESLDGKVFPDFRKGDSSNTGLQKVWNDDAALEDLQKVWRESKAFRVLRSRHKVLDGVDDRFTNLQRNNNDTQEAGSNSEDESPTSKSEKPGGKLSFGSEEMLLHKTEDLSALPVLGMTFLDSSKAARPAFAKVDLPSRVWRLLEIYFAHTHSWLPIVERHDLLRTLHQYQSEKSFNLLNTGSQAVLWAALALADVQYWSVDTPALTEDPDTLLTTEDLYQHARDFIPAETGDFDVCHVQALLILSLFNMGSNKLQAAWLMIGQAVRIALHLELDKTTPEPLQRPLAASVSRNKHAFLGCFALDTLLASHLGRSPHLGVRDILPFKAAVKEDGLEEWDPWKDCLSAKKNEHHTFRGPPLILSTFNRYIQVLCTMNEIDRAVSEHESMYQHFSEIHRHYPDVCSSASAPELRLSSVHDTSLLPHHFNLHVAHLSTSATLRIRQHRCSTQTDEKQSILRELSVIVQDWLWLVQKYRDTFRLSIAPPTFEFFFQIICESCQLLLANMIPVPSLNEEWRSDLESLVKDVRRVWPVFSRLDQSAAEPVVAGLVLESNRATQLSFTEVTSLPSRLDLADATPHDDGKLEPFAGGVVSNPQLMALTQQDLISTVGQKSGERRDLEIEQQQHVDTNSAMLEPYIFSDESSLHGRLEPESIMDSALQIGINFDQDVVFNEFSTVDAMEWSGIYDQSLLNLGFSSAEVMNHEFYEFLQDGKPS